MRARATPPPASASAPPPPAPAPPPPPPRRALLLAAPAIAAALAAPPRPAAAVQGLTAGRIPGLTPTPDADGWLTYTRPEGKSGGHGVGWSEIPRYSFKVPAGAGWDETPVSIADLGGTEIDLRFASPASGSLSVVVAPVLRFVDVGFNADVRIEDLGDPDKLINGFGPELFGQPLEEGDVVETKVVRKGGGLTYYAWALKPLTGTTTRHLATATAFRNRVFILAAAARPREWRKGEAELRRIVDSFVVDTK